MRKVSIIPGEYYHIYNRSVGKRVIFTNERDWTRFLFLILHLQSPLVFRNTSRYVDEYIESSKFDLDASTLDELVKTRYVELAAFVIMPNHFHLLVNEIEEGGVARYLQRVQEAYAKYFNIRYEHAGHLFQGTYQGVLVEDNRQLLHLSAYLHRNPRELNEWKNKEHLYPYSSYQDYLENRWGDLLKPQIITEQFKNSAEYKKFVQTSRAKENIILEHLI